MEARGGLKGPAHAQKGPQQQGAGPFPQKVTKAVQIKGPAIKAHFHVWRSKLGVAMGGHVAAPLHGPTSNHGPILFRPSFQSPPPYPFSL